MLIHVLAIGLGLVALFFGAEWLVRGAARLARSYGVSALVIGLTIVAFGNSSPEWIVAVLASVQDQGDIALGNVIGSNITNIGLILGLTALITPLRVRVRVVAREAPIMIAVSVVFLALALNGVFSRLDAILLLAGFAFYVGFILWEIRNESASAEAEFLSFERETALQADRAHRVRDLTLIAGGCATLFAGAHLLVTGAVFVAVALGISELVVGLTVIALGTSLPELATCLVAAFRREADIAIGNIIGSNIFNILAILGTAGLVRPILVEPSLFRFEIPVMILAGVLLLPLARTGFRLQRWEGGLLVVGYIVSFAFLLAGTRAA